MELGASEKSGILEFWNWGSQKIWNSGILEFWVPGERFSECTIGKHSKTWVLRGGVAYIYIYIYIDVRVYAHVFVFAYFYAAP